MPTSSPSEYPYASPTNPAAYIPSPIPPHNPNNRSRTPSPSPSDLQTIRTQTFKHYPHHTRRGRATYLPHRRVRHHCMSASNYYQNKPKHSNHSPPYRRQIHRQPTPSRPLRSKQASSPPRPTNPPIPTPPALQKKQSEQRNKPSRDQRAI